MKISASSGKKVFELSDRHVFIHDVETGKVEELFFIDCLAAERYFEDLTGIPTSDEE